MFLLPDVYFFHIIVQSLSKIDALYILPSSHLTSILSKPSPPTLLETKTRNFNQASTTILKAKNQTTLLDRSSILLINKKETIRYQLNKIQRVISSSKIKESLFTRKFAEEKPEEKAEFKSSIYQFFTGEIGKSFSSEKKILLVK
jgi:hypothetical protein